MYAQYGCRDGLNMYHLHLYAGSRPRKDQAVPAPYYLTHPETTKYCHTCGRVIGSRRTNAAKASHAEVKYCSDKCKRHKPNTADGSVEGRIERALIELLEGRSVNPSEDSPPVKASYQPKKGDPRIIVELDELEEAVFGTRKDPEKTFGRRRNRARRGVPDAPERKSVDMVDDEDPQSGRQASSADMPPGESEDDFGNETDGSAHSQDRFVTDGVSLRIRPPQSRSDVNFSVGGERGWAEKIEETPEMQQRRLDGARKAEEKETVKQAARRAVVFGLPVPYDSRVSDQNCKSSKKKNNKAQPNQSKDGNESHLILRKCEALMNNGVVEPSFAKGNWSIRWREE